MANSLITRINISIQRFEQLFFNAFGKKRYPDALCVAGTENYGLSQPSGSKLSIKDIIGDGFLWAVPKHRRTVEKRLNRKFGYPEYVSKLLKPKGNLRTCNTCGDDYEAGVLCPTCYKKVIDETKAMQDSIQKELKLEPVEKEVVVLYEGEKNDKPDEIFNGKRIVEMKKPRPAWFSKNLCEQTTQKPTTAKDVKPSELG